MKITAGSLFLALAVCLDSIQLISSADPVPTTLAQLFPEYERSGELPPVRAMTRNRETTSSTAFTHIGNHILPERRPIYASFFLSRGPVIFAWLALVRSGNPNESYIAPLWQLFPSLEHEERWVFDTTSNQWVALNENEFRKLGFGYIYELVLKQQSTAQRHRITTGNPVIDAIAHRIAHFRANEATNMLQVTEAEKINRGHFFLHSALLISSTYREVYDAVFRQISRTTAHHM